MITQSLKWRVGSETTWFHIAQAVSIMAGCLILVLGVRELVRLQLSEAQLALGVGVLLALLLQCGILTVLIMMFLDPKRRAA